MTYQPAGNYYDKYNTRNPIARALMNGFMKSFDELVALSGSPATALEVGCGEGELSIRLARRGIEASGVDIAPEAIEEARARIRAANVNVCVDVGSIYDLDAGARAADLIVCCEVLEHLEDTEAALERLHALCRARLIASVPREPLWRALNLARGKYLADLGNTPGHVQHWSTKRFLDVLKTRFEVIGHRTPVPWTMVLCRPKH
jgi:2-polyprenyl-3-methyl-5-hydroxy-6-metoxy-1,4-benzoquinol methylase